MFKINRSEHNNIWGAQKTFGMKAKPTPNVASNLPLGAFMFVQGLFVQGDRHCLCRGLDSLKICFNPQHEQHLQIVQINYKYFPANAHNRLVVSN